MARRFLSSIAFGALLGLLAPANSNGQNLSRAVQLSFEAVDGRADGSLQISKFTVRARNRSFAPIREVRITVTGDFRESHPAEHQFAVIESGEEAVASQVHELVYDLGTEPSPLVWEVEYDDASGNRIREVVR